MSRVRISDIKGLCDKKIFERASEYYQDGRVQNRLRKGNLITAEVIGRHTYWVSINLSGSGVQASCSCPYDWGGYCKHIIATLIALAKESKSFREVGNIKKLLYKKHKDELIAIILSIVSVQPELIEDLGLDLEDNKKYNPTRVVSNIFDSFRVGEDWDIDKLIKRLQVVTGKADELQERGNFDLARRIYFEILKRCSEIESMYGSPEIFSDSFLLNVAEKYQSVALNDTNFDKKREVIQKEVNELLEYEEREFIEIQLDKLIASLGI